MSHSVRRHLNVEIDAYDETIRRWIPGYERMLEEAAAAVAAVSPALVLDLGAGTGALSAALLQHPETARVELIDVDPEVLDQARIRLAGYRDRAMFAIRSFDDPFPECGAIAASLSLHHIATLAAKQDLFARAFAALVPGGVLVNADCTMPAVGAERDALYRYWVDHQVAHGIVETQAWQHFEEWSSEDTYLPLEDELAALAAVGFEARRVWNAGPMGVVVARKPESAPGLKTTTTGC